MKNKIRAYFERTSNTEALAQIIDIDTTSYCEGLDNLINHLSLEIEDLTEQSKMLTPGTDPLSRLITPEINEMKNYLIDDMFQRNLSSFLIVQYFSLTCELSPSPIDTEFFDLERMAIKYFHNRPSYHHIEETNKNSLV